MLNKLLSIWIVYLVVLGGFIGFITFESEIASGVDIIYVGSGSGNDSTTIGVGINLANEGDTVFVYRGIYQEHVIVDKRINLVGEGRNTTIIDALGSGDVVRVTADWVNVTGFSLTGSGPISGEAGIELDNVKNCRVFDVNASGNGRYGIFFDSSSNNIVEGNIVHSNGGNGVRVLTSSNNTILNNNVSDNWGGIYLMSSSHNNTLKKNNVSFNKGGGMHLDSSSKNTIEDNIISSNNGTSIFFIFSSNNIIRNNSHSGNMASGYYIDRSNNNTISGNRLSSNIGSGMTIWSSSNNTITGNHVSNSTTFGISLISSQNHNISGNEFINSGISIRGYELKDFDSHDISNDNMVNGKPLYFYKYLDQVNTDGLAAGQLILINCTNVILKNLIINKTDVAISIAYSTNVTVIDNNVSNNKRGIELISSTQCNIKNNIAVLNEFGGIELRSSSYNNLSNNNVSDNNVNINLYGSSSNVISGNIITSNDEREFFDKRGINIYGGSNNNMITTNHIIGNDEGFYLHYTNWNNITYNNISSNKVGFYLGNSHNNTMTGNYVFSNEEGLRLYFSADYNTITRNSIQGNELGINLSSSSNNMIYHNDIIDNVLQAYDNRSDNYWDNGYPSGGNYWSNYDGTDGDGDGIGDSPFIIDSDSQDNYPLMEPTILPPSAPQNLQVFSGDSYMNITWGTPNSDGGLPISNYRIYRGISSGGENFLIEIGNVQYHNDTSVINGITYFYRISAKNAIGEGPLSEEVNATPVSVPSAPIGLTELAGDSFVNLTWITPPSDGGSSIINYSMYRSTTSGEEIFFTEIGNVSYYNDTSVTNGVTYFYKVGAKNAIGEGLLSEEVNATPVTVPSVPTGLTAIAGDSFVNLTWDAPTSDGGSRIVNYRIYRSTTSGGEPLIVEIGNESFYNDTEITNGVIYYYKVSAVNSIGEGPLSDEVSVSFLPSLSPDKGLPWWLWILSSFILVIVIGLFFGLVKRRKKNEQQLEP